MNVWMTGYLDHPHCGLDPQSPNPKIQKSKDVIILPFQGEFTYISIPRAMPWADRLLPLRGDDAFFVLRSAFCSPFRSLFSVPLRSTIESPLDFLHTIGSPLVFLLLCGVIEIADIPCHLTPSPCQARGEVTRGRDEGRNEDFPNIQSSSYPFIHSTIGNL